MLRCAGTCPRPGPSQQSRLRHLGRSRSPCCPRPSSATAQPALPHRCRQLHAIVDGYAVRAQAWQPLLTDLEPRPATHVESAAFLSTSSHQQSTSDRSTAGRPVAKTGVGAVLTERAHRAPGTREGCVQLHVGVHQLAACRSPSTTLIPVPCLRPHHTWQRPSATLPGSDRRPISTSPIGRCGQQADLPGTRTMCLPVRSTSR